jgi:hypothetical protein
MLLDSELDTGPAFAAVKTMQPHIAKISSVKARGELPKLN